MSAAPEATWKLGVEGSLEKCTAALGERRIRLAEDAVHQPAFPEVWWEGSLVTEREP
jgi:hypothetical protein